MADKTILVYLDGAGNLHEKDAVPHFVLGGYYFLSENDRNYAKRSYIKKASSIRTKIGHQGELKAKHLSFSYPNEQTKLLKLMNKYDSLYAHVNIRRIRKKENITQKKDINNYKVYILTLLIRELFTELIRLERINSNQSLKLQIFIDQDKRASNGWYDLSESIRRELLVGKANNYYNQIPPVFESEKPPMEIKVQQFDSKCEPLGQAADMLVNRIWNNYRYGQANVLNHIRKEFP